MLGEAASGTAEKPDLKKHDDAEDSGKGDGAE
jgi:hypothetical protein